MSKLIIEGGRRLSGSVIIHKAKNAILPILAATVLNGGDNIIYNCPKLKDVFATINILRHLGCVAEYHGDDLHINSSNVCRADITPNLMEAMRSSVIFLGAVMARCGHAIASPPGGCEIGLRPIDLHIKAFKQLGISITEKKGEIVCKKKRASVKDEIFLSFPSVGATENIMLLASLGGNIVKISNAAKEPEIIDLANFLRELGARVIGDGTSEIIISGVALKNTNKLIEHTCIPDRIVAATYMSALAITGGEGEVLQINEEHMQPITAVFKDMGCNIEVKHDTMTFYAPSILNRVDYIRTQPHPGFPTDAQAIVMAALSVARGTSIFSENIFDNRYKHIEELNKMGADVTVDGRIAVVRGIDGRHLRGTNVVARDLRGAGALVVSGLNAVGETEVKGLEHLDRGYYDLENGLNGLGANVVRIN
ncbi:MAG: UDP-N-acetylglucosamine 1-carboxyvinyltransferase [Clostridiales bacterium]|jgi:UDP-N-acetylglucosamine 1-carboxyvinyltransferase|nr:UDP-N-acetylglucosamine 1-carboxyvinyltransferase [Clostridiales bacterium]